MRTTRQALRYLLLVIVVGGLFLIINENPLAQTQLPTPNGHVNDFAGVLDKQTKEHLEAVLENLKLRSRIDFYVATVDNTGEQDIFDFSRQLARDWNVGARTSREKSLLLVISVASRTSFTQFSRLVQGDLPEGVLGEMSLLMRGPLNAGRFPQAVDAGIQHFVTELAQKIGFSLQDIDKPMAAATVAINAEAPPGETTPQITPVSASETSMSRPRVVTATPTPAQTESPTPAQAESPTPAQAESPTPAQAESPMPAQIESPTPAQIESPTPAQIESPTPAPSETPATAQAEAPAPEKKTSGPRKRSSSRTAGNTAAKPKTVTTPTRKPPTPVDDEAEAEEVELTLTLPLPQRAVKLKDFLDTHPDSKARPRAKELLISTHAALGDQRLKNGDNAGGVEQLMLAIDQSDVTISDQLFSGVISQIPLNLYLRGEHAAAFKAAQSVETKFGSDARRLLAVAGFYLGIERGDEAARVAEQAVKLAPDLAEAHRILALGLHITLKLDEAAAEYQRALELDPNSKGVRGSLADLNRAGGRTEEALALYNEQLKADPKDRAAISGRVISLLELGRKDEAGTALETALIDDPQNLALLSGAAYWFAAHGDYDKALDLARKAVAIEPRYTWAQIALARAELGLKRPLDAERAIRFARQYGKFPTLNYELASALGTMGLYDEAVDVLRESFNISDGQIETRLAGRLPVRSDNFLDLLAPERRASIYQVAGADTPTGAKMLKDLLSFSSVLSPADGQKPDADAAVAAAREFASGTDNMRAYRQVYSASRLLRNNFGAQTSLELLEGARKASDVALESSVATIAVQADEFRELRSRAIAAGNIPDVAEAPRNVLGDIFRGRIEDLVGWALFSQEKYPEAIDRLKAAVAILPTGTPAWRSALWHLGVALEQSGSNEEALKSYIKSYNAGEPDTVRRSVIENLYRKMNGSLEGLDEKMSGAVAATTPVTTDSTTNNPQPTPDAPAPTESSAREKSPVPEPAPAASPKAGTPAPGSTEEPVNAEKKPAATPEPTPASSLEPTAGSSESPAPTEPPPMSDASLRAAAARVRSTIKITGHVLDTNNSPMANVVVVLISPSGTVLASTTNKEGVYSFTVTPSQKTYRIIPSKDGFTFTPIDRIFVGLFDDEKQIEFIGSVNRTP